MDIWKDLICNAITPDFGAGENRVAGLLAGLLIIGLPFAAVALSPDSCRERQPLSSSLLMEGKSGLSRGLVWLLRQQEENGSWEDDMASTAFALIALTKGEHFSPLPVNEAVTKAEQYLIFRFGDCFERQSVPADARKNEALAGAVLALLRQSDDIGVQDKLLTARDYLLNQQIMDRGEQPLSYGGFAAAPGLEPDLLTTRWVLEALLLTDVLAFGLPETEEEHERVSRHYRAALRFIRKCQPSADGRDALKDNGEMLSAQPFLAAPQWVEQGEITVEKRLDKESLWINTLVGVNLLLYVRRTGPDEIRLGSALEWMRKHWPETSLAELGETGFARAAFLISIVFNLLEASGLEGFEVDDRGARWRVLIVTELLRRQRGNGGWVPDENRETDGVGTALTTAWSVLSLIGAFE